VNFMVPGIICVLLMESLVILDGDGGSCVRRNNGTMEQPHRHADPALRAECLGKAIPFIGLGYVNVAVVILVGTFWFEVAIRGSLALLLALTGLFILHVPRYGSRGVGDLEHPAAGLDGRAVRHPPEPLLLGLHVPDREHATRGPEESPT